MFYKPAMGMLSPSSRPAMRHRAFIPGEFSRAPFPRRKAAKYSLLQDDLILILCHAFQSFLDFILCCSDFIITNIIHIAILVIVYLGS